MPPKRSLGNNSMPASKIARRQGATLQSMESSADDEDEEVTFHFTNSQLKRLLAETANTAAESAVAKAKEELLTKGQQQDDEQSFLNNTWDTRDLADKITEGERPPLQVTGGLPLDLYVPPHLREKILSGKFINLADLLEKDPTKHGSLNISLTKSGLIGQPRNNRITTFEQWDEAWSIYMTVFARKEGNPEKLPTLVKHRMNVITVKQKNGFWMDYDKQFRLLKELMGDELPFDTLHSEIYMKAMSGNQPRDYTPRPMPMYSRKFNTNRRWPLGYCFNFLNGKECKCTEASNLKHHCPECSQQHRDGNYTTCFRGSRGPSKQNQNTQQPPKPKTQTNGPK